MLYRGEAPVPETRRSRFVYSSSVCSTRWRVILSSRATAAEEGRFAPRAERLVRWFEIRLSGPMSLQPLALTVGARCPGLRR
jgi:hypothetical protein